MQCVQSTYLYRILLRNDDDFSLICTGDGFILVVTDHVAGQCGGEEMLRFAVEVQWMVSAYERTLAPNLDADDREFKIRIGLHRGEFTFERIREHQNAIGTGINLVARICNIGDQDHILVSEAFERKREQELLGSPNPVAPYPLHPIGVVGIKHGLGLKIYSCHDGSGSPKFGRSVLPDVVERQRRIDSHIAHELRRLIEKLNAYVSLKNIAANSARFRATILAPSKDDQFLAATEYRATFEEPVVASRVVHDLKPPKGIAAFAYDNAKRNAAPASVRMATGLPERYSAIANYVKRMSVFSMADSDVAAFVRPCRAYVALAFLLPVTNEERFVLSIDSLHDLFPEDSKEMQEIVEIMTEASERLGLLLEAKQPLPAATNP